MHLRRALLLFAIVLGVAAVATSISRPADENARSERDAVPDPARSPTPSLSPGPKPALVERIRLDAARTTGARRLQAGRAAVVVVAVPVPGLVEIEGLSPSVAAEPGTPARLDVLENTAGRHAVVFTPTVGEKARRVATLVVSARR